MKSSNLQIGIACRLVFALGLHQDLTPLLKTGEVTRRELEYRQMIFWGAFVNDRSVRRTHNPIGC